MKLMKELVERAKAPSPAFWVKVRNLATVVGSSAFTFFTVDKTFELGMNPTIISVSTYTFAVCAALVGAAVLTKQDGIVPTK